MKATDYPLPKKYYGACLSSRLNRDSTILEFKNGLYQGDLLDYKRHGKGIFLWDNGQVYLGDWEEDTISGFGIVFFPFGGHLYGSFHRNKVNGLGVLVFPSGDVYGGNWETGKLDGKYFCRKKAVWSEKKAGFFKNGNKETSVEAQKRILHDFFLLKREIIEKIPKEYMFQEIYEEIPVVVNISQEKSEPKKKKIGFLDLDTKSKGMWFYGMLRDGKADGLGLLFEKGVLRCKGVFQEGKLEGVGMQISNLSDIYDGIFIEGELYLGLVYDNERKNYVFGQFFQKKLIKIFAEGFGFPFHLMSVYKHNLYQLNLSYYYKYTSSEIVLINEEDRSSLYCPMGKVNRTVYKAHQSIPLTQNNLDTLITFGNEEEDVTINEAKQLQKDPCDELSSFVYFLDNGEPFEPVMLDSPVKKKSCHLKNTNSEGKTTKKTKHEDNKKEILEKSSTPKKKNTNNMNTMRLLKSQEEKLKKKWNDGNRLLKKNKSLEKLNIMIDDSRHMNKFQEIFEHLEESQFVVREEEGCRGLVHDFVEEAYRKIYTGD